MWDSNALSQLLASMPSNLGEEEFKKIQMLIDADKNKNNLLSGFDLCEMNMYAPFCKGCTRTSIYPCAISYLNFLQSGGINGEAEEQPVVAEQETAVSEAQSEQSASESVEEVAYAEEVEAPMPENEEAVIEEATVSVPYYGDTEQLVAVEQAPQAEIYSAQPANEVAAASESSQTPVKRKIRIAVARKRI